MTNSFKTYGVMMSSSSGNTKGDWALRWCRGGVGDIGSVDGDNTGVVDREGALYLGREGVGVREELDRCARCKCLCSETELSSESTICGESSLILVPGVLASMLVQPEDSKDESESIDPDADIGLSLPLAGVRMSSSS